MCRNIKMLFNFDPPVTSEGDSYRRPFSSSGRSAASTSPQRPTRKRSSRAIEAITAVSTQLADLARNQRASPRAAKKRPRVSKARSAKRFGPQPDPA